MTTSFDELKTLQVAEKIADEIWSEISRWKDFEKRVVGEQLARSADSIGANIAEAYGRYHYGDKLKFLFYARGSLFETKYWINRTAKRGLIAFEKCSALVMQLSTLAIQVNAFSQSLRKQRNRQTNNIKEESSVYETEPETDIFTIEEISLLSNLQSQSSIQSFRSL